MRPIHRQARSHPHQGLTAGAYLCSRDWLDQGRRPRRKSQKCRPTPTKDDYVALHSLRLTCKRPSSQAKHRAISLCPSYLPLKSPSIGPINANYSGSPSDRSLQRRCKFPVRAKQIPCLMHMNSLFALFKFLVNLQRIQPKQGHCENPSAS